MGEKREKNNGGVCLMLSEASVVILWQMRDAECHWEISESLWVKSKWSELGTPWACEFTFAELMSYNLCYAIFGALWIFIWPDTSLASPFPHLQHLQMCNQLHQVSEESFQHLMLGKSWVVISWTLPWCYEGNKQNQGRGSTKHSQLQSSTRNSSHRMRVRRVKDFCPCNRAEIEI